MQFDNVSIVSLGHVDAPHRITSDELEERLSPTIKRLGIKSGLLKLLTGIVARRFWDPGIQPSEVASQAAEKAIEAADLDRSKIDVVINASVCKDYIEPSVACLVHGNLKLNPECLNFDVGNACLAFLNGMEIVGNMIERNQVDYGLIVAGEGSRHVIESTINRLLDPNCDETTFRENFATLTLGSGAVAMILARSDLVPEGHRVLGGVTLAATDHNRLCLGNPDHMVTDASGLLKAGLELAKKTFIKATKELGWDPSRFDAFMLHQVGEIHISKLIKRLGLDGSKVFKTFPEFGNIGPAAIILTLCKALEDGAIKVGDRVALMGIGSGLNCSMMEVAW